MIGSAASTTRVRVQPDVGEPGFNVNVWTGLNPADTATMTVALMVEVGNSRGGVDLVAKISLGFDGVLRMFTPRGAGETKDERWPVLASSSTPPPEVIVWQHRDPTGEWRATSVPFELVAGLVRIPGVHVLRLDSTAPADAADYPSTVWAAALPDVVSVTAPTRGTPT